MARVVLPFPVLPGKTADDARRIAEEFRRRPDEYAESRRRLGVRLERAYLQTTPMGMFVVAYIESDRDFGTVSAQLAQSDLDMDKYFVDNVREIHGFDLTQAPGGPPPETIAEWIDPEHSDRRRGMAFSAPINPGSEDLARSVLQDLFSQPGMAESRREKGHNKEVVTLVHTPNGPVGAAYLEGNDPFEGNRRFAASTSPFDLEFKEQLRRIFPPYVDFAEPVPGIEEIFDSQPILGNG